MSKVGCGNIYMDLKHSSDSEQNWAVVVQSDSYSAKEGNAQSFVISITSD